MKNQKIKIGVHNFKPVVFQEEKVWTGFEIELWEKIAKKLNIKYEYLESKNFPNLLKDTSHGIYDMAIAGISRTIERSKELNMSFFTLDTGLGIATLPIKSFSVKDLLKGVFSRNL